MSFKTIALFGANGQLGTYILEALQNCQKQTFQIIQFIRPNTESKIQSAGPNISTKTFDATAPNKAELVASLKGVDVVISALNGKALEAQSVIQDAAADAGVKRFYPSEYGMRHIYRKPGDDMGYVHPTWNQKAKCNELAMSHRAISSGRMTYTIIGCGDFYNQDREKTWCPWTQEDVESYTIHIIGDPDAKVDFTHLADFAAYLVASLCEPELSANTTLNFASDHISHNEIAALLEKFSGRPVKKDIIPLEEMYKVVDDPSKASKELSEGSSFPVDFWFLVKGTQGEGRFWRPKGETHNHLFPDVRVTTFEKYFQQKFGWV